MKMIKLMTLGLMLMASSLLMAGQVNINQADATTLAAELTGVGDVKAQAIVAYRQLHGDFTSIDALAKVKGISQKTIDKNRDNIRLVKK